MKKTIKLTKNTSIKDIQEKMKALYIDTFTLYGLEALKEHLLQDKKEIDINLIELNFNFLEDCAQSLREEYDTLFQDYEDYTNKEIERIFSEKTTAILLDNDNILLDINNYII